MTSVSAAKTELIKREIRAIEERENVVILYACESGSRAWGFESQDSDYDVRFIYQRPTDWYLSILPNRRDVIELPIDDELDINGWDLRKALQLYLKSNPPLFEWLFSPIVYQQTGWLANRLRDRSADFYNKIAARYHYRSMAVNNFNQFLTGNTVIRKKYLYVLRPLLAVNWIERGLGVVPTEFGRLLDQTVEDQDLRIEINELVRMKKLGRETDSGAPIPKIHRFVESEIDRLDKLAKIDTHSKKNVEELDKLFAELVLPPAVP